MGERKLMRFIGPHIFLLFINGLPLHMGTDLLTLYADNAYMSEKGSNLKIYRKAE